MPSKFKLTLAHLPCILFCSSVNSFSNLLHLTCYSKIRITPKKFRTMSCFYICLYQGLSPSVFFSVRNLTTVRWRSQLATPVDLNATARRSFTVSPLSSYRRIVLTSLYIPHAYCLESQQVRLTQWTSWAPRCLLQGGEDQQGNDPIHRIHGRLHWARYRVYNRLDYE